MRLALVTTPWDSKSPVGAHTRELVRELADTTEIAVFVERGRHGADYFGWTTRAADSLVPREFDQVLYQLGDEREHAFMAPMLRQLGGCVGMHAWALPHLAFAAFPNLARGGWFGFASAVREGGLAQARRYRRLTRPEPRLAAAAGLAFNRSIVRFGDAFIVHDEELARLIRVERNAPTPIRVVATSAPWSAIASDVRECLERFPPPRTARTSLFALRVKAGLGERAKAQPPARL